MNLAERWPTILEVTRALGDQYNPAFENVAAELNLSSPLLFGLLLPALLFEPQPISAALLAVRNPYTALHQFNERLASAAGQFFLKPSPEREHAYILTAPGRHAVRLVVTRIYQHLERLHPLPAPSLERLAGLLKAVVQTALDAPEPPGKWCILHSRNLDPGETAAAMVRVDQYLSDLAAYRDDAHLASWLPLGVDGHAWEIFTILWRREAETFEQVYHKLERRGHPMQATRQALAGLVQRGWLAEDLGLYCATPSGQAVRQEAEAATERYFAAPWGRLPAAKAAELDALLLDLLAGLLRLQPAPEGRARRPA
jgi:hypothetical protein